MLVNKDEKKARGQYMYDIRIARQKESQSIDVALKLSVKQQSGKEILWHLSH